MSKQGEHEVRPYAATQNKGGKHEGECQGNYAVGPDYDGQIGHRYFDTGRYPAKLICDINCDALLIEGDQIPHYEGLLGNKQLAIGAADVQDFNAESPEVIAQRVTVYRWLPPSKY